MKMTAFLGWIQCLNQHPPKAIQKWKWLIPWLNMNKNLSMISDSTLYEYFSSFISQLSIY